jgi:hypothetical protein
MGLEKIRDSTLSRWDSTCQSHYPHFHSHSISVLSVVFLPFCPCT